jgi:hypothetical protein
MQAVVVVVHLVEVVQLAVQAVAVRELTQALVQQAQLIQAAAVVAVVVILAQPVARVVQELLLFLTLAHKEEQAVQLLLVAAELSIHF